MGGLLSIITPNILKLSQESETGCNAQKIKTFRYTNTKVISNI